MLSLRGKKNKLLSVKKNRTLLDLYSFLAIYIGWIITYILRSIIGCLRMKSTQLKEIKRIWLNRYWNIKISQLLQIPSHWLPAVDIMPVTGNLLQKDTVSKVANLLWKTYWSSFKLLNIKKKSFSFPIFINSHLFVIIKFIHFIFLSSWDSNLTK